jgi:hypothetical protein
MFFKRQEQFTFVYFSPAFLWSPVFKGTGFLKMFLPTVIPLGINTKRFVYLLKCMPASLYSITRFLNILSYAMGLSITYVFGIVK